MLMNALTAVLAQVLAPLVLPKLNKNKKMTDSVLESVIFFQKAFFFRIFEKRRKIFNFFEKYVLLLRIVV